MKFVVVFLFIIIFFSPAHTKPMSMVDLLNVPSVRDGQLSPDGKYILYVKSQANWKANKNNKNHGAKHD